VASGQEYLQRYELVRPIAAGGMAEVYLARAYGPHGFRKDVALKRILPRLAQRDEFEARFIAEAKLAVELTHSNIVQVLDFGRDNASLFIAMEYVRGADLATLLQRAIERHVPVPLGAAMHIAIELCNGIEFAHKSGVLHRDISHSNILLSKAGEVKIADFGIAKVIGVGENTGRIVGKWRYMSPEQARGLELDVRSDLFSTGAVLYELFTGTRLFGGKNVEEILENLFMMPIDPPSTRRASLPKALDDVILKALERDPRDRYPSAAALGRALTEVCFAESLVHTAEDVADLVGTLVPAPAASGPEPATEPAPDTDSVLATTQTIVRMGTDPTGLSRWEASTHAEPLASLHRSPAGEAPESTDSLTAGEAASAEQRNVPLWVASAVLGAALIGTVAFGLVRSRDAASSPPRPVPIAALPSTAIDAGAPGPDAAPATVRVLVTSEPKADVFVDDRSFGPSPIDRVLTADGAEHRIEVRKSGYETVSRSVTFAPGATVTLDEALAEATRYGSISIHVTPWAHVYYHGKKRGTSPMTSLRLPYGRHRLALKNPALGVSKTVTVTVPEPSKYHFDLTR